jgi:hypothetical protein
VSVSRRDSAAPKGGDDSLRGCGDATASPILKSRGELAQDVAAVNPTPRSRGYVRRLAGLSSLTVLLLATVTVAAASGASTAARFTVSPSAPVTGQLVTLDASSSTCASTPCTYAWGVDTGDSTWSLGTGQLLTHTFGRAGAKDLTLTVTDAAGQTSTVEHTVNVVAPGSSPPETDVASFTYSPSSPVTGQPVTFDGSASTCASAPCTYSWDDDGPDGTGGGTWPLGTGQVLTFTFQGVGTKYVRLTMTDANGQTATVEQNVVVGAPGSSGSGNPTPPAAPVNTAPPVISGSARQGQTLTTFNGTWTNSPTSFAYQWKRCSSSCSNISGATAASYTATSTDVGDTIEVTVTATNSGGSASQTSAPTAVVAAVSTPSAGCTTTISSGLAAAINSAAGGATICLNAGSYGGLSATYTNSSMVTITAASGVSPSQVVIGTVTLHDSSNLTFDHVTVGGGTLGDYPSDDATHVHFTNDVFSGAVCVNTATNNADVLFDSDTFNGLGQSCIEGRLGIRGAGGSQSNDGIVISNSTFGNGGAADGIQIAGGAVGTQIGPGDQFVNLNQGSCGSVHCDAIQFYGAVNTVVEDDYFANDSSMLLSADGNGSPMTVVGNVFANQPGNGPQIGGGHGDVFNHNTFNATLSIGCFNVGTSSSETVTNNIITGGLDTGSTGCSQSTSGWTVNHNLTPDGSGAGTGSITGSPNWIGGSAPSTWPGFALASSSLGNSAASDGTDVGATTFG